MSRNQGLGLGCEDLIQIVRQMPRSGSGIWLREELGCRFRLTRSETDGLRRRSKRVKTWLGVTISQKGLWVVFLGMGSIRSTLGSFTKVHSTTLTLGRSGLPSYAVGDPQTQRKHLLP